MSINQTITNALERAGVDDFSIDERANLVHLPAWRQDCPGLPVIFGWAYAFDLEERRAGE